MYLSECARNNQQITISRAATSTWLCLWSLAPLLQREAGRRLIFKRAAPFQMTQNSVLSGAPSVRSKLLCAVGGRAGRQRLHGGIFITPYFPPSGLTETAFQAQPGTPACSMEAVGMHQTCWGPVQAGLVAACLSNNYPRHRIPTVG